MRGLCIALLITVISGCSTSHADDPTVVLKQFYQQYLTAFATYDIEHPEDSAMADNSFLKQKFASRDTEDRIQKISSLYEQEILESDYYTYSQDYFIEWVSALKVGTAKSFMGGVVVPVSIGINDGKSLQLSVFMRRENGAWKIYRVKNETDNYEQPIFDAGRLTAAINHTKTSASFK
ncbi:DUF3828 domain-containing protein [Enterobacteriaceae bacterium RIT691]|nr:DUF3828 domain-containing protein [Enterobacteriaceae bacterium RIT691]